MSEYKIEKGILLPQKRIRCVYPYGSMEIGDSFLIPSAKYQNANGSARAYEAGHPGVKFTMRKISETETRIWRIA